jgi:PAS domain S-box-containing protein
MEDNKRSGLNRRRYWVAFFALVSLGFAAAGFRYYKFETNRMKQEQYREIKTIAGLKAGYIEQWRAERLADVVKTAKSPFFIKGLEDWMHNPGTVAYQENLKKRLDLEKIYNVYSDVLIAAMDNSTIFPLRPKSGSVDIAEKQAISESLKTGKALLSELYRSQDGNIYIDAVAPVIGTKGAPVSVLVYRSDATHFLYPLIQSWPTLSHSSETLIVRKDGSDVLFLNNLRHRPNTALILREPLTATNIPAVQAVLGKRDMFLGKDYRGVEVMADLRPVLQSSWFMVAKVDTAEILSEARYRAGAISLVIFLFILLSAAMTAYAFRHRQAYLYKTLYRTERKEKESYELFRTTLYSIGDAVITTDNNGFIMQMNPVAEHLTGRHESEAQGKPLEDIFHIINEKTRKKAESPVERVLKEGKIIGLANHTILIAREGNEHPIADSGAPIRDENGDIIGTVMVFRDQTNERRAQEALRRERDFAESLIDTVQAIILLLDTEGRIVRFNRYTEEISGYTLAEVQGKDWFSTFLPQQDHGKIKETFKKAIDDIKTRGNINPIMTKDGHEREIEWYDKTLKDGDGNVVGLLSFGQDVTERRQAQQVLRENEEKYREFFTTSRDCIFITSPSGQWIDFNDASLELFGYATREELLKTPIAELYEYPEERSEFIKLIAEKGYVHEHPIRLRKQDGTVMDTIITATSTRNEDSSIKSFIGTIHNITSLKHTEEALRVSIREKEILLRELHHRVKNNLQIISSLFMLESAYGQERDINTILKESRDRILAMSIVHEKLYHTPDMDKIGLKGYITDLTRGLIGTYPVIPGKLRTRIEIQDISLSINHAIPFGLIINELFTNAIKHAFPGDMEGEILIKLEEQAALDTITLTVSDNGTGIAGTAYACEPATLGLRLVRILVEEQLKGKLEIELEGGTTFNITFKRSELI